MEQVRRKLSYANVVATLALVIAVAGIPTAVAVTKEKAGKNTVTSKSIKDGTVTARDLARTRVVLGANAGGPRTASCGENERLLSGGVGPTFRANNLIEAKMIDSYPSADAARWNGWATPGTTVWALCLEATPGK